MSNLLYVGSLRGTSGWSVAARAYLESLKLTKFNLACKSIFMDNSRVRNPNPLLEHYEAVRFDSLDYLLQNALPPFLDYNGKADKNIGMFFLESQNCLQHSGWLTKIKQMDSFIVATEWEKSILEEDGVKNVEVVGPPVIDCLNKEHIEPFQLPVNQDTFLFYTIGEFTTRKNLQALIRAFHCEFHRNEDVRLVIKTSCDQQMLENFIYNIKQQLRIYPNPTQYLPELIITSRLTNDELIGLHKRCDTLVLPSCAESINLVAQDALYLNNPVIANKNTGMSDLQIHGCNSYRSPVIANDPPLNYLYTGREFWYDIDIENLMHLMRQAYENRLPSPEGGKPISHYSPENIAKELERAICQ